MALSEGVEQMYSCTSLHLAEPILQNYVQQRSHAKGGMLTKSRF